MAVVMPVWWAVTGACAGGRISASNRLTSTSAAPAGRSSTAPASIGSAGNPAGVLPSKSITIQVTAKAGSLAYRDRSIIGRRSCH